LNFDIWICLGFSALSLGFSRREGGFDIPGKQVRL